MERRAFLTAVAGAGALATTADVRGGAQTLPDGAADRAYMLDLLGRMASPVLSAMASGRLHAEFKPELSPVWDGRNPAVAYLECFGRLMAGIAPWLALPADGNAEGRLRETLRRQALASFAQSVDPASPDYLLWRGERQVLVDSAFFANALLRATKALWEPLDAATKGRIVAVLKGTRVIVPPENNWVLFAAMNEAFLLSIGEQWDRGRIETALHKLGDWYLGDGWYGDGPRFHFDYYGSYVIHPMLVEILEVLVATGAKVDGLQPGNMLDRSYRRMQRYGASLERMIGPDGSYPPIGRSLTYRTAVFQPLGLLAWRKRLPEALPEGQVRSATLAAQRAVFRFPGNFDAKGFLTLGFTGHQPALADSYSNAGSMYLAAESLLALGLPANDSYWTAPATPWTGRRAFAGEPFPKDHAADY